MAKIHVHRDDDAPAISCQVPEGFTVEEFFCKDFLKFPISPVRILVNGNPPSLKDSLKDGDEVSYVIEKRNSRLMH